MAEKIYRRPEPSAVAAKQPSTKAPKPAAWDGAARLFAKPPVLVVSVMMIEAAVLLAAFKMIGWSGPATAQGASLFDPYRDSRADGGQSLSPTSVTPGERVEVQVVQFKAPNKRSGRTFLYDVGIYVVTSSEHEAHVQETLKANEALIQDRVRTIIAQSDPEKLGGGTEPGLETFRRQVKYQLDEITGDGVIIEVLVPRCLPIRAD
jgi:flagellar basal body-associated protein FliL